jgi:hypothetical protein
MTKSGLARPGPLLQCLQKRKLSQEKQPKQAPAHKRLAAPSREKEVSDSVRVQTPKVSNREEVVRAAPKAVDKPNPLQKTKKARKESFDNTRASQQPAVSSQSDPFIDAEDREIARLEKLLGITKGILAPLSKSLYFQLTYSPCLCDHPSSYHCSK